MHNIDKKIILFLFVILAVLLFTFTLANQVNKIGRVPRKRTDSELLIELRSKYNSLLWSISGLRQYIRALGEENRALRDLLRARIIYYELEINNLHSIINEQKEGLNNARE